MNVKWQCGKREGTDSDFFLTLQCLRVPLTIVICIYNTFDNNLEIINEKQMFKGELLVVF